MASHALKMLTLFIFLVALINFTYYAVYWQTPVRSSAMGRNFHKPRRIYKQKHRYSIDNDYGKSGLESWTPEYLCGENDTNSVQSSVTSSAQVVYRDQEEKTGPTTESTTEHTPLCPEIPPFLGPINLKDSVNIAKMNKVLSMLEPGGSFTPRDCEPTEIVSIIVPYRGPDTPLLLFLYSVHLSVINQNVAYQILVIKEYNETRAFKPGLLYNIGFVEAQKLKPDISVTCVVFHDPYLAPMDSRNMYRCSDQPKQLVASVDDVPYGNEFGGVVAMRPQVFRAVNGFSNLYLDSTYVFRDMHDRLIAANYTINKSSPEHAIYASLLTGSEHTESVAQSTITAKSVSNRIFTSSKKRPQGGLSGLSYAMSNPEFKLSHTLIEVESIWPYKPSMVTGRTKSSNPLYDETTTPSTTTKPILLNLMSLQLRTRVLGL